MFVLFDCAWTPVGGPWQHRTEVWLVDVNPSNDWKFAVPSARTDVVLEYYDFSNCRMVRVREATWQSISCLLMVQYHRCIVVHQGWL
jgi:hypothetical protein